MRADGCQHAATLAEIGEVRYRHGLMVYFRFASPSLMLRSSFVPIEAKQPRGSCGPLDFGTASLLKRLVRKREYLQKRSFQRLLSSYFLPDMSVFSTVHLRPYTPMDCRTSVFSTVHLRPYTPMDCRTCVGLVSEESRRWYVVRSYLLRQHIGL